MEGPWLCAVGGPMQGLCCGQGRQRDAPLPRRAFSSTARTVSAVLCHSSVFFVVPAPLATKKNFPYSLFYFVIAEYALPPPKNTNLGYVKSRRCCT